ncbi:hypothetical protein GW17_00048356 [Ensete ventricosum]|nr:hypothetical protein GW17_00048356 [Ensete ventricosum]
MLSQPSEGSRVRKVASMDNRDTLRLTSGRLLRRGRCVPPAQRPWRAVGARTNPSDDQGRGMLQAGWPVNSAYNVANRQLPAVRGVIGWSARRIRPATLPTAYWQGCRWLVGPLRLLCLATGHLPAGVLPCYRPPVVRYATSRSRPNAR